MQLLIEINHPAHIHLFRNLAKRLETKNIRTTFLIKNEPVIERLAKYYGLSTINMGSKGKTNFRKYIFQFYFLLKAIHIVKKKKANLGMGVSMNLPIISKLTKMDSICLDDDDMVVTPVFAKYANKASVILTPDALIHEKRGLNHLTYSGYHELAYLHPNQFTADKTVLELLKVNEDDTWFVIRFNTFNAHHDKEEGGMSYKQKRILVQKLKEKGKVFVSSESDIDPEFEELQLPDKPELMHSILALTTMYIGESQTMTSEAAVLGTPAIKCNTFAGRLSIPNELEKKYELCYSYLPEDFEKMINKINELLGMENLKFEWQTKKRKMLRDKIDVTAFLVWLVENYPKSVKTLKYEPEDN